MIDNIVFPDVFKAEGRITVELFDVKTNQKIDEIKTENYISNGVRNILSKIMYASLFTQEKVTGGVKWANNVNNIFENIYLTDASHPEQPEREWLVKGNVIGWASSTNNYTGDDTTRGSYNSVESFTSIEHVHMVFDFPTHAANGTFESIYFSNNSNSMAMSTTSPYRLPFDVQSLKVHGSYIYAVKSGNQYRHFVKCDINFNVLEEYELPQTYCVDFDIYDNHIYFVKDSTNPSVMRAPLSDPTDFTTVLTGVSLGGIHYDAKKDNFILVADKLNEVRRYTKSFELLSTTKTDGIGNYISNPISEWGGDIHVGDQLLQSDDTLLNSRVGTTVRGFIGDSYVTSQYRYPLVSMGSRVLLDAPITKTYNVTMKITYDFLIPKIY